MSGPGDLDGVGQFDLVGLAIFIKPHPDHGLQTACRGNPWRELVSILAGKGPNPLNPGLNRAEAFANRAWLELYSRRLVFQVGTERNTMNPVFEDCFYGCP